MIVRSSPAVAAAILAAASLSLPVSAAPAPLTIGDLAHAVTLGSPAISPDGKRIAVVVRRPNLGDDTYDTELDLIDVATHARRTLTYKLKDVDDPAWSPSGDRIAFLADDGNGDDAKAQIFVMPMAGCDARPVTSAPAGVDQFAWRPDGDAFAYVAPDAPPKRSGVAKYQDSFVVGNNPITAHAIPQPSRLYVIAAAGGTARRLTSTGSITAGEAESAISWSPDGTLLAYDLAPNAVLNDAIDAHAMIVDVATAHARALTPNTMFESDPRFSPDGRHVSYTHSAGDPQITLNEAYVTGLDGAAGTAVSQAFDRAVYETAWAPQGDAIWFTCADGTQRTVVRASLAGELRRIDLGGLQLESKLAGAIAPNGAFAFVASDAEHPQELYVKAAPETAPVVLTSYNAAIAAHALGAAESVTYSTSLGITSDAVLIKPPGYVAGTRYPLVLIVHGGPTGSSDLSFDSLGQVAAAHGWLVLEPNYRGSDNHGLAYQRAVRYDPERGPGKDIMAAIDAVRARGIVDDHRIAISGWSYGGIMTAWMITHYHIWRAAVSGAPVTDWSTDYSVSDDSATDAALFHGSPWVASNRAEWHDASVVEDAQNVTTPVLLLHDVGDNRDAITNSYEFYHALKDHGKDVTFIAWPVAGHFPADPVRVLDVENTWLTYIARHF
jgi:dipeptidyl aminopeptidase/acylaminoacyl peptidase